MRYVHAFVIAYSKNVLVSFIRKHFTFIIAFPAEALIPQRVALAVTDMIRRVMIHGETVLDALLKTCFVNEELMRTTGVHLTLRTPGGICVQRAYAMATHRAPWGVQLRCANAECDGHPADVSTRSRGEPPRTKFTCVRCKTTTDYIQRPDVFSDVDVTHHIVSYPLQKDGVPIRDILKGRWPVKPVAR